MSFLEKYRDARPPVEGFPMSYDWERSIAPIFDQQIKKVRRDIHRERSYGNKIVYLSCPISNRGGGYEKTNVAINRYTSDRIVESWGSKVWVLNPSEYQMQSYRGAERLLISASLAIESLPENEAYAISDLLSNFAEEFKPSGADYMRMWTKVLVESFTNPELVDGSLQPYGSMIDIYYFLGSKDVEDFFAYESGGKNKQTNVELFLSKEIQSDPDYEALFNHDENGLYNKQRFIDFYTHKASAMYSKGCHDEWNIWVKLNLLRIFETEESGNDFHEESDKYGVGNQIPGYWNQQLINPASSEQLISRGYAAPEGI